MSSLPTDKILAVIPTEEPSPVAYMNLYDPGDVWMKVQGCEACAPERAERCCGSCPHRMMKGCDWHFERGPYKDKPLRCCITPIPSDAKAGCALVYECVQGPQEGKRRHVTDKGGVVR